jgi:hypothetical protein
VTDEQTATATRPTATRPTARTLPAPAPAPSAEERTAARTAAPLVPARDDFTFAAPPARRAPSRPAATSRASSGLLWTATATAVVVLSGFFVLVVSGRVVTEGPVVLVLTRTHGVHLGDLFALGAWGLAVGGLLASALASTSRRR